jgi:hypothetical protein
MMTKENSIVDAKNRYIELCESETTIPIFSRPWWLDCVSGEYNWGVCLVEKDGEVVASMPYMLKKRLGFNLCTMPLLTHTLGPWIRLSKSKYTNQLSQQKKLMNQLIDQLPEYDYFLQNWHYSQTNYLAFFWKGFQQRTKYTYVIEDLTDLDRVWSGFQSKIKNDIRKARERFKLVIDENLTIDDFIYLNKQVFQRKNITPPYSDEFIISMDQACNENNASKMFIAVDEKGRKHAAVYIIWDHNSAYYILGGGDPELRNSGAGSLCMWEAIKFASMVSRKFDFEGSMIETVESFFRAFGATQKPYFSISHTPSVLLRLRAAWDLVKSRII